MSGKRSIGQRENLHDEIGRLQVKVAAAMLADRRRFYQRLSRLRASTEQSRIGRRKWPELARLRHEIQQSVARHERRQSQRPVPVFPDPLPVVARREQIAEAIAKHPVVVICGETGSGKTTQLPKICLELGRGAGALIGHTQPRRIAARSVARHIARELKTDSGGVVGYKVRFSDRVSPDTYIKLMTDGILLAESQGDRLLQQYDTLIIDEAHERSLNIDFLLGYLKRLIKKRLDLRLIITSATIDPERFSRHFDNAPIVEVSGRTYPVEVRYRPVQVSDENDQDRGLRQAILAGIDEVAASDQGDILVFLSGEREIRETAEALRKHHPANTDVLPLYARLSASAQDRVFQLHPKRRIVLATNVAETSLTVPGIRYVVDSGYARISRYSHRTKVLRLPIEPISQASADQRKGRCGRTSAGICIRLYSQEDYASRPEFTEPEILRTNLAGVILQMKALGLGDVERFPFIDRPDPKLIKDGFKLLTELGALDTDGRLTAIGRQLAKLPVDPRLGRMILAARDEGCVSEVLIIASALSVQDPRERPLDATQKADERHRQFMDERSDFLAFLRLWYRFNEQAHRLSNSKLRVFCREHFLSYIRMQNWHDTHQQLLALVKDMGFAVNRRPAEYANVHRALLVGLLANIGLKSDSREYLGARGTKLSLFPGSALFDKSPKWIVAAELVETARVYARTVATIEPGWIEQVGGHLCRRAYLEPHWDRKRAAVIAYEQVTIYGLVIVAQRTVDYGPIDPVAARSVFIRQALVRGECRSKPAFLRHNEALIAEIEALEHRARRQDVLVNEDRYFGFYDQLIPEDVYDGVSFERWRTQAERQNPKLLFLARSDLMRRDATDITAERFPDHLNINGINFSLDYHFEPGHPADGLTVTVPVAALNQLGLQRFDRLVPGLLREKVIALIKSLPKSLRRYFLPAPELADACLQALGPPAEEPLTRVLGKHLTRMTGVTIPDGAWKPESLAPHLRMNFKLVDAQGGVIAMSRDLHQLQRDYGESASKQFSELSASQYEKHNISDWDFGELPQRVVLRKNGQNVYAFPALSDEVTSVSLRLFDAPDRAEQAMRAGLRRLFMLRMPQQMKYLRKNLPGIREMCARYVSIGSCTELKDDLTAAIVDHVFVGDDVWVRDAGEFERREREGKGQLMPVGDRLCGFVSTALARYEKIHHKLQGCTVVAWESAIADIRDQLDHLIYKGFVSGTPHRWLPHLPRYLEAILARLLKLEQAPGKDRVKSAEIAPIWQAYRTRVEADKQSAIEDRSLQEFHWWLEELRVSLFAQELKTAFPVSLKRVQKKWAEL